MWLHDPPTSTFEMANITIHSIYFSRLRKFSWMRGVAMSCNSRRPRGNSEQHQDFSCQFGKPESMSDEIQQKCQACCWKVKLCWFWWKLSANVLFVPYWCWCCCWSGFRWWWNFNKIGASTKVRMNKYSWSNFLQIAILYWDGESWGHHHLFASLHIKFNILLHPWIKVMIVQISMILVVIGHAIIDMDI